MPTHRSIGAGALALSLTLIGVACGGDDAGDDDASATEGTSGVDDPLVVEAVGRYETYVRAQVDETIAATATFTDAVRAGDLAGARAAYAPSRQGWERIEPIAGLVEVIDGKVDARVDDFEDEADPDFTGWHRPDLWDFAANVEGSAQAFRLLAPALAEKDPGLVSEIEAEYAELDGQLAEYADGAGGYRPYRALAGDDKTAMQTTLASLSEHLATMAGALGLG